MARSGRRGIGFAAGIAAIALTGIAVPAQAQEGTFLRGILGTIGLIPEERDPIEYRDRPALVVPPAPQLPRPVDPEAIAERNPAWPRDPDVEARRLAAEEARRPVPISNDSNDTKHGARLSIQEIRAGRRIGGGGSGVSEPQLLGDNYTGSFLPPPDVRSNSPRPGEQAAITYGQEPERRFLSDPPTGLRRPASTAPIPGPTRGGTFRPDNETGQTDFATTGRYTPTPN